MAKHRLFPIVTSAGAPRSTWLLASATLLALAFTSEDAVASCTYQSATNVFALTGDVCTAAAGVYAPLGVGFFAYSGGVINSPAAVTIDTTGPARAYGAWSYGTGAQINFAGPTTISTIGLASYGLYASHGGAISLTAPTTISTAGKRAFGLRVSSGGAVSSGSTLDIAVNGSRSGGVEVKGPGSLVTLEGPTNIALNAIKDVGLSAAFGGAISVEGPTTINALGRRDVGVAAVAGAVSASGALNITTTQIPSTAFLLTGISPSIIATGGGTVSTAGDAIDLIRAANAVATFDNFRFDSASGNLIGELAVPCIWPGYSTATINFNNTVAVASYNLLDTTAGSAVTLNANASTLTGAIQTDSKSTANVNLTNGTFWTMTGSSMVSNLTVANSVVVFAPPGSGGAFKTLTVNNYVGSGANVTLNAVLGGSGSASDQIVINGGRATGSTLLTIKNIGGAGGQTSGAGIPIVVATDGATIAPNAFALANTPVVGGYKYGLDESNDDWYLVSSPTSRQTDIQHSVDKLAKTQQQQIITNDLLASILLGAAGRFGCSTCSSGFASAGSFSLGASGQWSLSDRLTLLGGVSYNSYSDSGATVDNAPMAAASLHYDFADWGSSRPFVEFGGAVTPYEQVQYSRSYANGPTTSTGYASTIDRNATIFGRAGLAASLTSVDQAAVYGELDRDLMQTGGFAESENTNNPYPASVPSGLSTLNVAKVGGQYTRLFTDNISVSLSAALDYGFSAGAGSQVNVVDFGPVAPGGIANSAWGEYSANLSYRIGPRFVASAFVIGTMGGEPGWTIHGGGQLQYSF
jgi:hypothetical protein